MEGTADLLQMLVNVSGAFPAMFLLIQTILTLIGVILFSLAWLDLYYIGSESRYLGAGKTPASIAWRMLIGVILTGSLWMMNITQNTLYGTPINSGAMLYETAGLTDTQKAALEAIMGCFAIVGYIGFGKGWMALDKHFNGGKDGVGGALAYIIGGTLAVYMDVWLPRLSSWTGFDFVNILVF